MFKTISLIKKFEEVRNQVEDELVDLIRFLFIQPPRPLKGGHPAFEE